MAKFKEGDVLIFPPERYPGNKGQTLVVLSVRNEDYKVQRHYSSGQKAGQKDSPEIYRFHAVECCTELFMSPVEVFVMNKLKENGYLS